MFNLLYMCISGNLLLFDMSIFFSLDYLLHKEKQIPLQLMEKWRKAALVISYASVFCTFVLGISAFSKLRVLTTDCKKGFNDVKLQLLCWPLAYLTIPQPLQLTI